MNEMYSMGLSIHSLGTVALLGVVLINILYLKFVKELHDYKRKMSIFLIPLNFTALGTVVFTGIVMMAAKHLAFDTANIAMIVVSAVLMVLEIKRVKKIKYINPKTENGFTTYKKDAMRILLIEIALITAVSVWMWWLT